VSRRSRRLSRAVLGSLLGFLLLGLGLPLVNANLFRNRVRLALEAELGRRVEVGGVSLSLLTGPAFQLHNVVIGEDPAFGVEHFAYMSEMQARLRLRSLWTGRVQVSSLTLIEPSLNLVKNPEGRWNFQDLLRRAAVAGPGGAGGGAATAYFPYLGVDGGRINLKFGDFKSSFYFQDVDAAISPPRDAGGRWRIRFAGTPARSERLLSGMGRLDADGYLTAAPGVPAISMDLELRPSPMGHLLSLVGGGDLGVHGEVGARARLTGELAQIHIAGSLDVEDVHRWDVLAARQERVSIPFHGSLGLPQEDLRLETKLASGALGAELRVRDYLSTPQWDAAVAAQEMPVEPAVAVARHLGAALPPGLRVLGRLTGRLRFDGSRWPQGSLALEDGQIAASQGPALMTGSARVNLDGPEFDVPAFEVRAGKERLQATASGRLDGFRVEWNLGARGLPLEALRAAAEALRIPGLHSLEAGHWDGQLFYRKAPGERGVWSGAGTLSRARWRPAGLESPVVIARARVRLEPGGLEFDGLAGSLGAMQFSGSYRRRLSQPPAVEGADTCRLRIQNLDLAQLDRWLNPKQREGRWAIWRRAIGLSNIQEPSWLKAARIEGSVAVDELRLGRWTFHNIRAPLVWDGETLALEGLQAKIGGAAAVGSLEAAFGGAAPRYRLRAAVSGLDLKSLSQAATLPANFRRGGVDGRLELAATGRTRQELRAGLKALGSFEGRGITLADVERQEAEGNSDGAVEIRSLRGDFHWSAGGLELTGLRMTLGREVYEGRGSIGGRPAILFEVASSGKSLRLVGVGGEPSTPAVP